MAIGVFGLQVAYKLKRLEVMSTDDTHGWFGGGSAPITATVGRIDFSNDTQTAVVKGSLNLARYNLAATGNSNYGWFGGGTGSPGTDLSYVDRIDFSNDSATASPRGSLSRSLRSGSAATGNSNYGWFGGGSSPTPTSPYSTVDRIDFSNDSGTASSRGALSLARYNPAATGNSNYGWFGGGGLGSPLTYYSTVDRIDFSNDSATASPRGPLSFARTQLAATGNSNYGWFCGGFPGILGVDRIDFSNDSATALVRGPISGRSGDTATGNSNYGWVGGNNPATSIVERIDFSNDTPTASIRGPLSLAINSLAATSGQAKGPAIKLQKAGNYGWFGGGYFPAITLDRIDFSNDSATASLRTGTLSLGRDRFTATGNSNYGWFGGGKDPAPAAVSRIDRIDFSNDSTTASIRGPLSSIKNRHARVKRKSISLKRCSIPPYNVLFFDQQSLQATFR